MNRVSMERPAGPVPLQPAHRAPTAYVPAPHRIQSNHIQRKSANEAIGTGAGNPLVRRNLRRMDLRPRPRGVMRRDPLVTRRDETLVMRRDETLVTRRGSIRKEDGILRAEG